jgi:hypothetical protein
MEKGRTKNTGLERLLKEYKKMFRVPENLNYYSKEDYQEAERKFLKYVLVGVNRNPDAG